MRPPSENFRSIASTFHSMSVGGTLLRIAEKNLVLDLKPAQLGIEYVQLFVDRHRYLRSQCRSVRKARARYRSDTKGMVRK